MERGRGGGDAGGGRDDGFGKEGNYWESEEVEVEDHGLLELTSAETNPAAAKLQEIKDRHIGVDGTWKMIDLRSRWHVEESDVSRRMAELRVEHDRRLVEWDCGKLQVWSLTTSRQDLSCEDK